MGKKKRKVPGLNQSSTADISFILLIFFLVTTSMDTDQGLGRTLPRPPEDNQPKPEIDMNKRDIMRVYINMNDDVMLKTEGNDVTLGRGDDIHTQVKEIAKEFIANKDNNRHLPVVTMKRIAALGEEPVGVTEKHVISVQTDRATHYNVYFQVQDALVAAYNELREELAKERFGVSYEQCSPERQQAIRDVYPQKISEAEPKEYGKK